ncbi:hypothetical protein KR51_00024490 [Rubidibacter lacunae KORDI 51-2]|uniref:Transposase n=1 Tax=Rubidibacter lacunae KORDI 51-2 TaxID=582515 RepID=U5DHB3_9CHRO|nr:hypothetical protein KR51_00024490 [Rubidibacter lacunae KORDI 51-2]
MALDAVRGVEPIAALASQCKVCPTMINNWKRQLSEETDSLFDRNTKAKREEDGQQAQIDELYRQIEKLKVERDFSRQVRTVGLSCERSCS